VRLKCVRRSRYRKTMIPIGTRIEETGTLVRDGAAFVLRRDAGGRFQLELQRVPVNDVEKRVRVVGIVIADGLVSVDGVAPA
jgi:hypothetical protein